jgi:hypothetical protein
MIKELEIYTPNLRGAAVTVENQIHGIFKLSTRKPNPLTTPENKAAEGQNANAAAPSSHAAGWLQRPRD